MLDDKNQDNVTVKEEPAKNETVTDEAETPADTEDIAAKQALLANLLFAQSTTPVQNEIIQQNTNVSAAEQVIQPMMAQTQTAQTMENIQNMDQNVQTQQVEVPAQTEQVQEFTVETEVKTDVKTDAKVEQTQLKWFSLKLSLLKQPKIIMKALKI